MAEEQRVQALLGHHFTATLNKKIENVQAKHRDGGLMPCHKTIMKRCEIVTAQLQVIMKLPLVAVPH